MTEALCVAYGNPSSGHRQGEAARRLLLDTRATLQHCLDAPEEHFIFTGSGTEANNLAMRSLARHAKIIITSKVEHSSILSSADQVQTTEGKSVEYIRVNPNGVVDMRAMRQQLATHPEAAVSIQWINNETGVFQPIDEIVALARDHGSLVHIDAAQAVGKTNVSLRALNPDFLTLTAHKFNGPAGVGVLYARRPDFIDPICVGGGQQGGRHAGTENIAGIAGLKRALELRHASLKEVIAHMRTLRDTFEQIVLQECPWVRINGKHDERVCNTSNLLFDGIDGQALVGRLDSKGIYCSQSSACTTGRPEPSHVLRAMGLSESQAYASARFSFGITNTLQETEFAARSVVEEAEYLKRIFA
ncbi:cysteine desulfurase [Ectothiorhodospira magna]|uniref:Cysteine desulfurase n=1 Tax=Ectothiorhodospira magna TaxID=867345 RepID=A0A1H9DKW8_9GAMM|nr:cysteine desulfurase [Ectothiorhodospira magna]